MKTRLLTIVICVTFFVIGTIMIPLTNNTPGHSNIDHPFIDLIQAHAQSNPPLVPEPSPVCPKGMIIQNNNCITPTTFCGEGTTYQDDICVVNQTENSNQTKNQNEKWSAAYPDISKDSEPEEPTISDEQEQMMREYCETGIHNPDMMGIPQCIKNELVCGPGFELVDGICHLVITDFLTSEDHNGMGGFILIGIPAIIAITIISVIGYKKS